MEYEIGKVIPNYKGRWKQSIYEDLDVVAFEGKTYISLVNNNSEKPSEESTKWRILLESPISQADVNNLNNIFLPMITDKLEEISKKIQENTDDIKEQRGLVLDSINTSAFVRTKLNEFGQRLSKIEKKLGI
jgi:hypothetical protein|nr:MAG TPA: hypothetical protein [Caudoviricetes sp.]DAY35026.1 MAG TPA: hypothetical protein [Caudoviricetes sp.]